MSNLSMCMCGSEAISRPFANSYVFTCSNTTCFMSEHEFAFEHWQALMGRGELVGYVFRRSICSDHDPADCEEYDEFVSRADVDLEDLAEYEKHGMVMEVYTQAPAVSSDPARFRQIGFTRIDHIGKPSSTIVSDTKYRAASDAGVYVPVFVDEGETLAPAVDDAVLLNYYRETIQILAYTGVFRDADALIADIESGAFTDEYEITKAAAIKGEG